MGRLVIASVVAVLACAAKPGSGALGLTEGQRVKVDVRQGAHGRLTASKVQPVPPDRGYEIEGCIARIQPSSFEIGPFRVLILPETRFETAGGSPSSSAALKKGLRVKVKSRKRDSRQLSARSVRLLHASTDKDIEITADIEQLDPVRGELTLLSAAVRLRSGMRFAGTPPGEAPPSGAALRLRRDDDERNPDPIRIGRAYLGGRLSFDSEHRSESDMSAGNPDRHNWLTPSAELAISVPFGEFSEAYARLGFSRSFYQGDSGSRQGTANFDVREAFVLIGNFLHPSLALQVGRQRFRDRREWLYDDQLDAVRLYFARGRLNTELSVAKGLFGPTGSRSDQYHFIARSQYDLPGRRYLSGYVMKRNDLTARDEDPIWFGLSSHGRIGRPADYWLELAGLRGRRAGLLMRGLGYDAGLTWRLPLPLGPSLSAGYAHGSGDANLNDGVDGNFRQTSLNDNSSRFHGLKRYRYYGVLAEPELNNLKMVNIDLGVRPSETWSVNVSYHIYHQAVASRRIGGIELDLRPNGRSRNLGREFDVVFALRAVPRTDINAYAGLFLPGPAFSRVSANPLFLRLELRHYF